MTQPLQYTWATLSAKIESEAADSDAEFVAQIQSFVSEAEIRVLRDLDLELFETWEDLTINSGDREAGKPTDVIAIHEIFVRTGGTSTDWMIVRRRGFEFVIMYQPNEDTLGVPQYFCDLTSDKVYVVPTPDVAYAGGNAKARCLIRPSRLDSSNTTTWLSKNVPDLLFHAAMIPAYRYLKHPAKVQESAELYASLLGATKIEFEDITRKRYKQLNTGSQGADD